MSPHRFAVIYHINVKRVTCLIQVAIAMEDVDDKALILANQQCSELECCQW